MTYTASHGLQPPTNEVSSRPTALDSGEGLDEDIAQAGRDLRAITSATEVSDDPVTEANLNANLISAFEYAKFADFDPEATQAAMEMFIEDEATSTPQFTELSKRLRESRLAAGLSAEPDELISIERLDDEFGAEIEDEAQEMLDEPLTAEEAAALHAQAGGKGKNVYKGGSYRSALKRQGEAPDPMLRRMIAVKRRDFGEELTAEDEAELKNMADEQKSAGPVSEGKLRLPSRGSQS